MRVERLGQSANGAVDELFLVHRFHVSELDECEGAREQRERLERASPGRRDGRSRRDDDERAEPDQQDAKSFGAGFVTEHAGKTFTIDSTWIRG